MSSTRFFTNEDSNTLINKIQGIFQYQNIHCFDILIGYFRSSGYFKIRPFLENVPQIRILVGINVDQLITDAKRKGQLYLEDPGHTKEEFLEQTANDIAGANYNKETEEGILQFMEDIISRKVCIRAYGTKNLHSKIYIFRPEPFNEHTGGNVIMGSSNLTQAGLGIHDDCNYEFNVLLTKYEDVEFATTEFEKLWKDGAEILPADIRKLKKRTYLSDDITPYELYIKMLIEYFGDTVIQDQVTDTNLPEGYTSLQYQTDAVAEGYAKLMKHNGFILADVVGLGKTVVATRILKRYIGQNGFNTKILVIYPNALEVSWKSTIKDFGLTNYVQFISNGSLHKIIDGKNHNYYNPEDYDLIVVDESHKFRSSVSNMYGLLELICKTPRLSLGNDLNPRKKVMLISATPLNNKPEDIANQIYLFQDARKSTIEGVPNLQSFFADKIENYKQLQGITEHAQLVRAVKEIYLPIRDKIFKEIVIRRTRADIQNIKRYKDDIKQQGLYFPKIREPRKIEYAFNEHLTKLFIKTVNQLVEGLGYYRYRAIEFLNDEFQSKYDNALATSKQLVGIRRTQMVKRLESSFYAFKKSLQRFQLSNQLMIDMFQKGDVYIAADIDLDKLREADTDEEMDEQPDLFGKQSSKAEAYKTNAFRDSLLNGLKHDQEILNSLMADWEDIGDYDPKFDKFLAELKRTFMGKNNIEKKLIIFSESKETVEYLGKQFEERKYPGVLTIDSGKHKQQLNTIRRNFDANYDKNKQENQYNILIATEVLAEGINLHRSNVILNYDIPWNATRLMQRIGRVNRIGTQAPEIFIYNFYPTSESNSQIHLNETALRKIQAFHAAFSEDSKIYSEFEELVDSTLGDLNPKEETDERLQYLELIRELYLNNPREYIRLKKLPLKSRVSRLAAVNEQAAREITGNTLANASLTYLRNNMKEGFYVSNQEHCIEITFLQAVKLFEAARKEKSAPAFDNHFAAVEKAISQFKEIYNKIYTQEDFDTSNLSVQERNAVMFLRSIIDLQRSYPNDISEDFAALIKTSIKIIYLGVFRKFRNEISSFATKQKREKHPLKKVITEITAILERYPIHHIARMDALRWDEEERQKKNFEAPKILLTETFI